MNRYPWIWLSLLGLTTALACQGCAGRNSPGDSGVADADGGNPPSDEILLCTGQQDCQANEECQDGVCMALGSCSCNSQCSKADSEVCDHAKGRCMVGSPPTQCSSACDCYTGESCSGGSCVPSGGDQGPCQVPGDCPAAETCQNGACVPKGCTSRDDCAGATCQVCRNGLCSDPQTGCAGINECCLQFHCNFGTCVPDASGCTSDSDCHDPPSRAVTPAPGGACPSAPATATAPSPARNASTRNASPRAATLPSAPRASGATRATASARRAVTRTPTAPPRKLATTLPTSAAPAMPAADFATPPRRPATRPRGSARTPRGLHKSVSW